MATSSIIASLPATRLLYANIVCLISNGHAIRFKNGTFESAPRGDAPAHQSASDWRPLSLLLDKIPQIIPRATWKTICRFRLVKMYRNNKKALYLVAITWEWKHLSTFGSSFLGARALWCKTSFVRGRSPVGQTSLGMTDRDVREDIIGIDHYDLSFYRKIISSGIELWIKACRLRIIPTFLILAV